MANNFGLTTNGFKIKQQSDILQELQTSLSNTYGSTVNLSANSVFGQLAGIFSEREALIWQLLETVYLSQYPSGAEGSSVDNILSLTGLKRLQASPSSTPITFYGDPNTYIPSGTSISQTGNSSVLFTTNTGVTIGNPQNEIQFLSFSQIPTSGTFQLSILSQSNETLTTSSLSFNAQASDLQTAIRALSSSQKNQLPFTDVLVTGSQTIGFQIQMGAVSPQAPNPSSGASPQNLFQVLNSTLMNGTTQVNVQGTRTQAGMKAQAIAQATCTQTGPISAASGSLTVILNPISGLNSCTNEQDALLGTNLETDSQALIRRENLLSINSNGPLQGIQDQVSLVPNVTQVRAFQNETLNQDQSFQVITFSQVPTSGSFSFTVGGINGTQTQALSSSSTFTDLQTALNAIPTYSNVNVTGDFQNGFQITFPSQFFTQSLFIVSSNTLMNGTTPVSIQITGGRPGKSFEIVVEGGDETAIATAIYKSKPAGIQSYGNTGPILISDTNSFQHPISFSRPTQIPIYIKAILTVNPTLFPTNGAQTIQNNLTSIGNQFGIGGTVITFGSNGLSGAFNSVPGIIFYELFVGLSPNPSSSQNISLLPFQLSQFESFNCVIQILQGN